LSGRGKRTPAAGFSPPPTLAPTNADTLARLAASKSAFPSAEKHPRAAYPPIWVNQLALVNEAEFFIIIWALQLRL
jgi:hypothetical protein